MKGFSEGGKQGYGGQPQNRRFPGSHRQFYGSAFQSVPEIQNMDEHESDDEVNQGYEGGSSTFELLAPPPERIFVFLSCYCKNRAAGTHY